MTVSSLARSSRKCSTTWAGARYVRQIRHYKILDHFPSIFRHLAGPKISQRKSDGFLGVKPARFTVDTTPPHPHVWCALYSAQADWTLTGAYNLMCVFTPGPGQVRRRRPVPDCLRQDSARGRCTCLGLEGGGGGGGVLRGLLSHFQASKA